MVVQSLPISQKAKAKAVQQAAKAYGMSMPELTALAKECIEETAYKGAALVKKSLVELANGWLEGDQPPDDITFVVFEKNRQKQSKKKEIPLSSPPPTATA